jgi:nucleoside phosphorylase
MPRPRTAARDLIEDLAPSLVLVVGIASGAPSDELKLGDVILSTMIHDFTVEGRKLEARPMYAATGPVGKALADSIANLAAREDEMGDWTADLPPQPPVAWTLRGTALRTTGMAERAAGHAGAPLRCGGHASRARLFGRVDRIE